MSTVDAVNPGRRRFLTLTATVVGGVGAAFVAVPFLKSWSPSRRAKSCWRAGKSRHQQAGRRCADDCRMARQAGLVAETL